jgi:hypothetical protein
MIEWKFDFVGFNENCIPALAECLSFYFLDGFNLLVAIS